MTKKKKLISCLLSVSIVIGGTALFIFQHKEDPLREKQWYLNTQWYETSDYQFGETQVKYTQQISENRNRGQHTTLPHCPPTAARQAITQFTHPCK